jgi:hypothetical protein
MSPGDIEHYEAALVLKVAERLANGPISDLAYRTRKRHLDRAVDVLHLLFNDPEASARLRAILLGRR